MTKPRTKTTAAKKTAPSAPSAVPLFDSQRFAIATLCRRTGLSEGVILAHLIASGLYWTGLDAAGEDSFNLLLVAAMGQAGADESRKEHLGDSCWDLNAPRAVATREAEERRAARPDWFLTEAEA